MPGPFRWMAVATKRLKKRSTDKQHVRNVNKSNQTIKSNHLLVRFSFLAVQLKSRVQTTSNYTSHVQRRSHVCLKEERQKSFISGHRALLIWIPQTMRLRSNRNGGKIWPFAYFEWFRISRKPMRTRSILNLRKKAWGSAFSEIVKNCCYVIDKTICLFFLNLMPTSRLRHRFATRFIVQYI